MNGFPIVPIVVIATGMFDFVLALALYLYLTKLDRKRDEVRRRWRPVPATIVTSRLAERSGSKGGVLYSAEILYQYEVDGKQYQGDRCTIYPKWSSSDRGPHQKRVDQYPKGSETKALVDPRNPTEAVLTAEDPPPKALRLVLGILVGSGIVTIVLGALLWGFKSS